MYSFSYKFEIFFLCNCISHTFFIYWKFWFSTHKFQLSYFGWLFILSLWNIFLCHIEHISSCGFTDGTKFWFPTVHGALRLGSSLSAGAEASALVNFLGNRHCTGLVFSNLTSWYIHFLFLATRHLDTLFSFSDIKNSIYIIICMSTNLLFKYVYIYIHIIYIYIYTHTHIYLYTKEEEMHTCMCNVYRRRGSAQKNQCINMCFFCHLDFEFYLIFS